jgi:Zn-dependent protease
VLLGEPSQTQADLSFRLFGFPVRITPWFWLTALLLGWNGSEQGNPKLLLSWVIAVLISILIHELGHALAFRRYGISAHVVLYQFGGLAIPDAAYAGYRVRRPAGRWAPIVISAAGPAAQLLVAALLIAGLLVGGKTAPLGGFVGRWLLWLALWLHEPANPVDLVTGPPAVVTFLSDFLYVSVYWALLNLFPIYPLDGGQISRELFLIWDRGDGLAHSLMLSVIVGGAMAAWGFFLKDDVYLGILFGMLAYGSYTALQAYLGRGGFGRPWS